MNNKTPSKNNNSLTQSLSNQLNSKHKIDARKDIEKEQVIKKEHNIKTAIVSSPISSEKISKFDEKLKAEAMDTKLLLPKIFFGLTFGISSVFPTLSTASFTAGTNVNEQFKSKMYSFFKPGGFYNWLLHLLWLLPLFLSSIFAFSITFTIVYFIIQSSYGPGILLGTCGIPICLIFIYYMIKKIKLPIGEKHKRFYEENNYKKWLPWVIIPLAIIFVIVIAIIARFAWTSDFLTGFSLDGYSFANQIQITGILNSNNYLPPQEFQTSIALLLIAAGFFAGFVNFIPGLSSGLFLSLFGSFQRSFMAVEIGFGNPIESSVTGNFGQTQYLDKNWAWPIIIIIFTGYVLGIVSNIFFIRWLETKSKRISDIIYFGLMIGGSIASFIAISPIDYAILGSNKNVLALGLSLFFMMIALTFITYFLLHRFKLIHLHDKFGTFKRVSNNA